MVEIRIWVFHVVGMFEKNLALGRVARDPLARRLKRLIESLRAFST